MEEDNRTITDQEYVETCVLEEDLNDDKDWELYEKFERLYPLYGGYVQFHCNKCNSDDFVFNLDNDKSCHYCNGTKEDIELIEDINSYKQLCKDNIIIENDYDSYVCRHCYNEFQIKDYILNDLKCPICKKTINNLVKSSEYDNEEFEQDEEYNYTCENCYEQFSSIETENIKCSHCGYIHKELAPIDPADKELEWIPSDDEYEDVFSDD